MSRLASLSPEAGSDNAEEAALWAQLKTAPGPDARERLFGLYSGFAANIARRHARETPGGDIEYGDLRQFAYAGLLEALDRFDPDRGAPFRAFAAHRISGSIRDGITHSSELREQISWRRQMRRDRLRSLVTKGVEHADLPQAMEHMAQIAMGLAIGFMLEDTGLIQRDDPESGSAMPISGYDSLAWREIVSHLQAVLATMPHREQMILRRHYLEGVNFDQLALVLGLSRGRISQIHRAALEHLRKRMAAKGHFRLER